MRIGRGLPRRRDPRRRFRNRLLVGMVGVALLPLVTFAVLAVFELDTVAKSTANATESAILQRQQAIADSALDSRATSLDRTMSAINVDVQDGLTGALVKALTATQPPAPPAEGPGTYLQPPPHVTPDSKFAGATAATGVAQEVTLVLKNNPSINAVYSTQGSTTPGCSYRMATTCPSRSCAVAKRCSPAPRGVLGPPTSRTNGRRALRRSVPADRSGPIPTRSSRTRRSA